MFSVVFASLPLVSVMSQMNPAHLSLLYLSKMYQENENVLTSV